MANGSSRLNTSSPLLLLVLLCTGMFYFSCDLLCFLCEFEIAKVSMNAVQSLVSKIKTAMDRDVVLIKLLK